MEVTVRLPAALGENRNKVLAAINKAAVTKSVVERVNKGEPDDHWVGYWDDSVAPVPTEAEMVAVYDTVNKASLYRHADRVAARRILGDNSNDVIIRLMAALERKGGPPEPGDNTLRQELKRLDGKRRSTRAKIDNGQLTTRAQIDAELT